MTSKAARTVRGVSVALGGATLMVLAVVAGTAFAVPAPETTLEYGAPVAMGDGTARVYVEQRDGAPIEFGIALTEQALNGLPDHHTPGGLELEPGHMMFFSTPELPRVNPTAYQHVLLGWNPAGHSPPGIYDQPHFDFHFYTIPNEARLAMQPSTDPEFEAKASHLPPAEQAPEGYMAIPGGVPLMGAHWVDPTTPELNGELFTKTFLFGSWDGEMIFHEPMITRAYLATRPNYYQRIPVPAVQAHDAWVPSAYRIYFDEATREYRVALTDFVWRDGAEG